MKEIRNGYKIKEGNISTKGLKEEKKAGEA
jgi:hypothetical protein